MGNPGTVPRPYEEADTVYEHVRFAECSDAYFNEPPEPNPETATKLRTYEEEVPCSDGEGTECVRRERWLYCFRLEESTEDREVYVSEYFVNEDGDYQKVVGDGPDRQLSEGTPTSAIKLKTKALYDDNPKYFFWLTDVQLSASRITQLRKDLKAKSIKREDLSPRENLRSYIEPVSLQGRSFPRVLPTDHEHAPEGETKARYVVNLIHPWTIAERRHDQFQDALYAYVAWMTKVAPVRHLNDLTLKLTEANESLAEELRTKNEVTEALDWRIKYAEKQRELWAEDEEDKDSCKRQLVRLVQCLKSPAFTASLIDYVEAGGERRVEGCRRFANLLTDLDVAKQGKEYLRSVYEGSDVYSELAQCEREAPDEESADPTAQRQRLARLVGSVQESLEAADDEEIATTGTFNALNEAWKLLNKGRQVGFEVLEAVSSTVEVAHERMGQEVLLSLTTTAREYVASPGGGGPSVELGPRELPRVSGEAYRAVPVETPSTVRSVYMGYHVYEIQEVGDNVAGTVVQSGGAQAVQGGMAGINLILAGIALKNWEEKPVQTTGQAVGAVADVVSFGLDRKVRAVAETTYKARVSMVVQGSAGTRAASAVSTVGSKSASQAARVASVALARVGIVVEVVVGAWSVGSEMNQGDWDGALAQGIATAGGLALTGAALLFGTLAGGILFVTGVLLSVVGIKLVSAWDEDKLGQWIQKRCIWGEGFENPKSISHTRKLVGENALKAPSPSTLTETCKEQLEAVYELFYDFSSEVEYDELVYGQRIGFGGSDPNIPMTLVRIERAMPNIPLPTDARFEVQFSDESGMPDQTIQIKEEKRARLPKAKREELSITEPQKLLTSTTPQEREGGSIETSETLVLRYVDTDHVEQVMEKEGSYRSYPVGVVVPGRDDLTLRTLPKCTVRLVLGEGDAEFKIKEEANRL